MESLAQLIVENGVTIVIVALFLWDWIVNKKSNSDALKQLAQSNNNIATSLELLKQTNSNIEDKTNKIEDKTNKIYEKMMDRR